MSDKHGKMTYEEAKALGFLDDPEQPDGIAKTVQKLHENLKAVEKERIDGIVAERTAEIQKQLDIADERLDQETPEIARLEAEVAKLKEWARDTKDEIDLTLKATYGPWRSRAAALEKLLSRIRVEIRERGLLEE